MRFVQYTLVGGGATAVHYALLLCLVEAAQVAPGWAAAIGAAAGALVGYVGNRRFAFAGSAARHRQALPRFLTVAALGVGVSGSVVWFGSAVLGLHYVIAQLIATTLVLVLGYQLNRAWSFA
jgi:putative flippase GtrA